MRMQPSQPPQVTRPEQTTEGKATLNLSHDPSVPAAFYNPRMSLNRDLAILFAKSYFNSRERIRICDPMCGSGVRSIRYAFELPGTSFILAGDKDTASAKATQANVLLNCAESRVSVVESDANLLLLNHEFDRFDLVDLDPFGSPAPFFESALRATTDMGVLAATATDMGPLSGARASAGLRKYGVTTIRSEFEKEMAARTLAGCLATIAARIGLGINIAFTHATDNYVRIYAVTAKGKTNANLSMRYMGFVEYCQSCLRRDTRDALSSIQPVCENCKEKKRIGGRIWVGKLWDQNLVKRMIERSPDLNSSRLSEIQKLLALVQEECEAPAFYYRTDVLSARLKTKPPKLTSLLEGLREKGYQATRTHFDPTGFRSNAPAVEIASVTRSLSGEAKPQEV